MIRAAGLAAAAFLAAGSHQRAPAPGHQTVERHQDPVAARRVPFAVGERLEYEVKFGPFRVGRATMEVAGMETVRGVPAYHVIFVIRGHAAFFYSMTDTLESWFSAADLTSLRFVQNNNENGTRYYHRYEIHPVSGYFIQDGKDSLPTTEKPLDDASFFYFARTVPLEVGRTYSYNRYFKLDRNPVTLTVLSVGPIDTPAGRFTALAVRPVFKSRGLFAEGGQAIVYLADDSTRIPLMIKSRVSIGSLTMSLRSRR